MTTATNTLPLDYNEWRNEWAQWRDAHADSLRTPRANPWRYKGKNFLADEVLGVWKVNGRMVELSSVTFPNFEDRDPNTGRLLEGYKRRIGVTFADGDTDVVGSFADLEAVLGL